MDCIQKINRSWYRRNFVALGDYFHNDIVFNSPDFKNQIKGKASCIQTYADFMKNSEVLLYEEGNPQIQIVNNAAIATYEFEMKYKQNGNIFHETGVDILGFNKTGQTWLVIWRGMSFF